MHGAGRIKGLRLLFAAGAADVPATPVEVLGGPDGELYVRFTRQTSEVVSRALEIGTAVETPWPGRKFAVLRRYDHARVDSSLEAIEPVVPSA